MFGKDLLLDQKKNEIKLSVAYRISWYVFDDNVAVLYISQLHNCHSSVNRACHGDSVVIPSLSQYQKRCLVTKYPKKEPANSILTRKEPANLILPKKVPANPIVNTSQEGAS